MILCENLCKRIKNINLENITICIEDGQCTAIVGDDVSGKDELINLLVGISSADSGRIWIDGKNPNMLTKLPNKMTTLQRSKICFGNGYDKYPKLTVKQWIGTCVKADKEYENFVLECIKLMNIDRLLSSFLSDLSTGEKRKIEFVKKIYQNPQILILNEAFQGLDVYAKEILETVIKRLCKEFNKTVILVCANISAVQNVCDRIFLISNSKIIYSGNFENLQRKLGKNKEVIFKLKSKYPDFADIPVKNISLENKSLTVTFDSEIITAVNIIDEVLKTSEVNEIYINEIGIDKRRLSYDR